MKKILSFICALCALLSVADAMPKNAKYADIDSTGVYVDGKPMRLLAGEMHYFRVLPEQWKDSLLKLRACGLNTVSTYSPWNLHEPKRGEFVFSGGLDLKKFLQTAKDLNIKVMFRPGPYICSEWDFGGLPWWLNNIEGLRIRSINPQFMEASKAYLKRILEEAEEYFCNNGGPIIAIQLDNGYASFSNDIRYIETLRDIVRDSGFKGILYTADGDSNTRVNATKAKGVWRTLMIGNNLKGGIDVMNKVQPNMPQMISEYWVGQGLRAGRPMYHRDINALVKDLDSVLAEGVHICCYMFHGGTTFGLMSGALIDGKYTPFTSSYEVDAVLNEAGDTTPKYDAFRKVFLKYNPDAAKYEVPANAPKKAYGKFKFTKVASMRDNLKNLSAKTESSPTTLTMEEMGYPYGFIHYSSHVDHVAFPLSLRIDGLRDRAWISLDGKHQAIFDRNTPEQSCNLNIPEQGARLDILVENRGRLDFGLKLLDNKKGILNGVVINKTQQYQANWTIDSIPLTSLKKLEWKNSLENIKYPAFFSGEMNVENPAQTFIKVNGTRGYIWINGFLLGRYDSSGPIVTSFIPAPLLKSGKNTIEILELESMRDFSAESLDNAIRLKK